MDKNLKIKWPTKNLKISKKDKDLKTLNQFCKTYKFL